MSDLRALISAARADAPSTAARANVWAGVSTVVGEVTGAAVGASGAAAGSIGAAKMLVLGTLLGGSVTVGIGAAMLLVGHAPTPAPGVSVAAPAPAQTTERSASSMAALAPTIALNRGVVEGVSANSRAAAPSGARPVVRIAGFDAHRKVATPHPGPLPPPVVAASGGDALAREASSLAEARRALSRHDALSALQIVRDLRAMPGRQLVPEELAVEAQALRGLGLDDEANAVETCLRVRFPDSVLGR